MSVRHPSEGIAFEPLSTVAAGLVGGAVTLALLWHIAFRIVQPKEKS